MVEDDDAFLEYETADGVADFHSLRHSFISNLARSGVHPKDAQALARHSTIVLTMDRYSHIGLQDMGAAVASLPAVQVLPKDAESTRTGGNVVVPMVVLDTAKATDSQPSSTATTATDSAPPGNAETLTFPGKDEGSCRPLSTADNSGGGGTRTRDTWIMNPLL